MRNIASDADADADDRAIVTAVINLARSVWFTTIVEGVETPAQQSFLIEQGCDEVQGYLFSKPIAADKIPGFIANLSQ